jgi:hypothetical protein
LPAASALLASSPVRYTLLKFIRRFFTDMLF